MKLPQQNPRIPEGINNPSDHPLRELLLLGSGICAALLLAAVILRTILVYYTQWLPFSWEARIAPQIETPAVYQASRQQLQIRLDRLLVAMDFDQPIKVPVNIIQSHEINAFATLGPQIAVTSELLETIHSETGLDMILAHEAAHIIHRDPLRALAGTLGVQLLISIIGGDYQIAALTNTSGSLLLLNYSREQETAADDLALHTLYKVHGSLSGADEFFQQALSGDLPDLPSFLSTHPHPHERIEHIREFIQTWAEDTNDKFSQDQARLP